MVVKRSAVSAFAIAVSMQVAVAMPSAAQQTTPPKAAGGSSLAEVGHKLSNPLSNVWALFTEFDFVASDGDRSDGHPHLSGAINFEPVMPIPLYGAGSDEWKVIVRPSVPLILGSKDPARADFNRQTGLSDTLLPLLIAPPVGKNWLLGAGPTFTFPTATRGQFGRKQILPAK